MQALIPLLVLGFGLASADAMAAVIRVDVRGHLSDRLGPIPAALADFFEVGNAFSGSYRYADNLTGTAVPGTSPTTIVYEGISSFEVTINSWSYSQTVGHFEISNDTNGGTTDHLIIKNGVFNDPVTGRPMSGPTLNGHILPIVRLTFEDQDPEPPDALDSTDLPTDAPDVSAFSLAVASFTFFDIAAHRVASVDGVITSAVENVAAPEPATPALLLLAVMLARRSTPASKT